MGRRLPLLALLIFAAHAQQRRVADRHVLVNLNSLPPMVTPPSTSNSTPRPFRTPGPRTVKTGGSPTISPGHTPAAPALFTGFLGLLDNYGPTPPDTGGAVGPNDVFTMLNSQVAVQSRSGAMRPNFPMDLAQFWSALGPFVKIFDPRILYDASADRWIAAASSDPGSTTAALLLAISVNGDPAGSWRQFQIALGGAGVWADYPVIGINNTWITLSANLLDLPPAGAYDRTEVYVFSKTDLYQTGKAAYTAFSDRTGQFTPAVDQDSTADTMYFAQEIAGSPSGRYRFSLLRGPAGSESFTAGAFEVDAGVAWGQTSNTDADFAPQLGSYYKIDTGDSRLQNCVLRGGSVWCAHTVFLPAAKPTRSAVQWFQVDAATQRLVQLGQVDDATGSHFYAYPTIAVNRAQDAVVGFTRFTATDYPSGAFSFRRGTDAPHAMHAAEIFKAGEAAYVARGADEDSNRWGDVSATMVDPVDDQSFWTIQEFAAVPTNYFLGRWGTWWANILMDCCSGQ